MASKWAPLRTSRSMRDSSPFHQARRRRSTRKVVRSIRLLTDEVWRATRVVPLSCLREGMSGIARHEQAAVPQVSTAEIPEPVSDAGLSSPGTGSEDQAPIRNFWTFGRSPISQAAPHAVAHLFEGCSILSSNWRRLAGQLCRSIWPALLASFAMTAHVTIWVKLRFARR
jgi:hypothetical protein